MNRLKGILVSCAGGNWPDDGMATAYNINYRFFYVVFAVDYRRDTAFTIFTAQRKKGNAYLETPSLA